MATNSLDPKNNPISMEYFIKNLNQGYFACVVCECGARTFIASAICPKCKQPREKHSKWVPISWSGTIQTFCITYVGPPELADITPYISTIVNFGEDLNISAILNQKFDPYKPPLDLINKEVEVALLDRPDGKKILGVAVK